MKRLALLIGAPGQNSSYLPGVGIDINNYINFLVSPIGGAWREDEIISYINPSATSLINLIKRISLNFDLDYLFVAFSGHGAHDDYGSLLAINNHEQLYLNDLCPQRPKKQLFIIDACRNIISSSISGINESFEKAFSSNLTFSEARAIFGDALASSDDGRTICYSCSIDQSAKDSDEGGLFTSSLFDEAKKWSRTISEFNTLPIDHLFYWSSEEIEHLQTPQIVHSDKQVQNWFPFALKQATQKVSKYLY